MIYRIQERIFLTQLNLSSFNRIMLLLYDRQNLSVKWTKLFCKIFCPNNEIFLYLYDSPRNPIPNQSLDHSNFWLLLKSCYRMVRHFLSKTKEIERDRRETEKEIGKKMYILLCRRILTKSPYDQTLIIGSLDSSNELRFVTKDKW